MHSSTGTSCNYVVQLVCDSRLHNAFAQIIPSQLESEVVERSEKGVKAPQMITPVIAGQLRFPLFCPSSPFSFVSKEFFFCFSRHLSLTLPFLRPTPTTHKLESTRCTAAVPDEETASTVACVGSGFLRVTWCGVVCRGAVRCVVRCIARIVVVCVECRIARIRVHARESRPAFAPRRVLEPRRLHRSPTRLLVCPAGWQWWLALIVRGCERCERAVGVARSE